MGVMAILGASLMWAIEPILAKLSYRTTDFVSTFETRIVFCLAVIAIYIIFTNKARFGVERKNLPPLIYVSLVATLFADFIYIYALTMAPVINAVLIGHMQPIFIVIFGFLILRVDRLTRYDYLGIFFMIVAGLLVTSRTIDNLRLLRIGTLSDLYILAATVAWATTALVARKYLKGLHAGAIAFCRFLFATIILTSFLLISSKEIVIANPYQVLIGFVIGIGTILYYEGLNRIKAAQVSALELSTPFFATIFGILVLKEFITMMQGIGITFLFGGIYFLSKKE